MKIAEKVEKIIKEKGITKKWLAQKCNIKYKTFMDRLYRDRFTAYDIVVIGKVLDVDLNELKDEITIQL